MEAAQRCRRQQHRSCLRSRRLEEQTRYQHHASVATSQNQRSIQKRLTDRSRRCVCDSLRRFENSRNMESLTSHEYDHVLSVLIRPPTAPCSLCASYESRTDGGSFSGGRLSF